MTRSFLALLVSLSMNSVAVADDLYHVTIDSQAAAERLKACGLDAVIRTDEGYLLLGNSTAYDRLARSGLSFRLIATGVKREELALDTKHDNSSKAGLPLLFEEPGLRLYRFDAGQFGRSPEPLGLMSVAPFSLPISCFQPRPLDYGRWDRVIDLDSATNLIQQDSLESYAHILESFYRRVTGTGGAYLCRDWLVDKLTQFGYDSVVIDSFVANIYGVDKKCHNVIAYKVGSTYPLHSILLSGHRDAVPGSPGADDDGSGTCGVLEMARVMADFDTRLTLVFIFFDAEEQGMLGSWHYAARALEERDSIALMLNMDMIANYQNDSDGWAMLGLDTSYALVWGQLADSLESINLTPHYYDGSAGDDWAFQQAGFNTLGVTEYEFSPFYHSSQDSTTYLNFDYETRMVRATLATACAVDGFYSVEPMVAFAYPNGVPETIYPGVPDTIDVALTGYAGDQLVPGSGQFHYCVNGGDTTTVGLIELGAGMYQAELPAVECTDRVEFYFSAEGEHGGVVYDPQPSAPLAAIACTGVQVAFHDDFETDQGWTVTGDAVSGNWTRDLPDWSYGLWGAPIHDYDHSSLCYLTDRNIGGDVDDGYAILTSPAMDLSDGIAEIEYARWYSNDQAGAPHTDVMKIYISINDGQNWALVETLGPVENASGGWFLKRFWADQFSASTDAVRLRFVASDLGEDSHIEAAVDAVKATVFSCSPLIITRQLPDGTVDEPYARQLVAVGGDGTFVWSDLNNDLAGTGLTLSSDGNLAGTPVAAETVSFTAHAEDGAGDYDERTFNIRIGALFICGDIDNSGADPDISDLVYLVDYMFTGGPLPPIMEAADVDGSGGDIDISDLVYLVDYMFTSGPPPLCP